MTRCLPRSVLLPEVPSTTNSVPDVHSKLKISRHQSPQYYYIQNLRNHQAETTETYTTKITTIMSFQKVELYGGAMTVDLPSNFADVRYEKTRSAYQPPSIRLTHGIAAKSDKYPTTKKCTWTKMVSRALCSISWNVSTNQISTL